MDKIPIRDLYDVDGYELFDSIVVKIHNIVIGIVDTRPICQYRGSCVAITYCTGYGEIAEPNIDKLMRIHNKYDYYALIDNVEYKIIL